MNFLCMYLRFVSYAFTALFWNNLLELPIVRDSNLKTELLVYLCTNSLA